MSVEKIYLKEGFFKFLVSLEELREKKEKSIFVNSVGINDEVLLEFANFLDRFDVKVIYDENYIYPLKEKNKIQLELNLSEWFALQLTLDTEKSKSTYYAKLVINKMEDVNRAHSKYSLTREQNTIYKSPSNIENFKKQVDYFISKGTKLELNFHSEKTVEIFPYRLVYLDGTLCVVGEDIHDRTLSYFAIEDIKNIHPKDSNYQANLSQIEINEFIGHLRLINGNEERLILKIYSQPEEQVDLMPTNHFLGNPFVTSNPDGEMIWAANLEMCEELYQWLYLMRDKVEILDPGHIRKEFAHYCKIKNESKYSKKAS